MMWLLCTISQVLPLNQEINGTWRHNWPSNNLKFS